MNIVNTFGYLKAWPPTPAYQPQEPAYPLGGGGALPDYNGNMWGGNIDGTMGQGNAGYGYNGVSPQEWAAAEAGSGLGKGAPAQPPGKEQGRMGQGWFNEPVPPAYQPGSPYGPGYFDSTFGEANNMNDTRSRIAGQWMAQPDFGTRYPGADAFPQPGSLGGGIQSLQDALGILNSVPDWQSSTYTQPPEGNRWGGG